MNEHNDMHIATISRGVFTRRGMTALFFTAYALCFLSATALSLERVARVSEVRRSDGGELRMVEGTPFLILKGTPYEMGHQYGVLLRDRIKEILAGGMDRLRPHLRGMPRKQRERLIRAFEASMPEQYRSQIRGVAEGAEIPYPDLLMTQYFDEILRFRGCSSILAKTGDGLIHAHNLDYIADLFGDAGVVIDYRPARGTRSVTVGFIGDCGALAGMNDHGITVSIDAAPTGKTFSTAPRIPAHFILRAVLDSASTMDSADRIIREYTGLDGYILAIGSADDTEGVIYDLAEGVTKRNGFRDSPVIFATNDYLHPDLNTLATLRMCPRFSLIEARTHAKPPSDVDDLISILSDPGEFHGVNNPTTIQSVVLDGSKRTVYTSFAPSYAGWGMFLKYDLASGIATVYRDPDTERIRQAESDIREIRVIDAFWSGDPGIPRAARRPGGDFILAVRERFSPETMSNFARFVENAGSEFVLRATDRPDVRAQLADPRSVSGKSSFSGVWLKIIPEDKGKLARDIPYSVHPPGQDERHRWTVEAGVRVMKPSAFSGFIRSVTGAVGL